MCQAQWSSPSHRSDRVQLMSLTMLHKAVERSVDKSTSFSPVKWKGRRYKSMERKRSERKRNGTALTRGKKQRRLRCIPTDAGSTSFAVSHLSPKPLDPQGERLTEEEERGSEAHVYKSNCAQCSCDSGWQPRSLFSFYVHPNICIQQFSFQLLPRCFGKDSRGSAVRGQNSKVKKCRWESWPPNPLRRFHKPALCIYCLRGVVCRHWQSTFA